MGPSLCLASKLNRRRGGVAKASLHSTSEGKGIYAFQGAEFARRDPKPRDLPMNTLKMVVPDLEGRNSRL